MLSAMRYGFGGHIGGNEPIDPEPINRSGTWRALRNSIMTNDEPNHDTTQLMHSLLGVRSTWPIPRDGGWCRR